MMENLKYKLVRGSGSPTFETGLAWRARAISFYRIKALRDIPEHNVKAGDLGGFVSNKFNLSQSGSCWIAPSAKVLGNAFISGDAYVGGYASVLGNDDTAVISISGKVKVGYTSEVILDKKEQTGSPLTNCIIMGDIEIQGFSKLVNVASIDASGYIRNSVQIKGANQITGEVYISGQAFIGDNVTIAGKTYISDKVDVKTGATVINSTLLHNTVVKAGDTLVNENIGGIPSFMLRAAEKEATFFTREDSRNAKEHNAEIVSDLKKQLQTSEEMAKTIIDEAFIAKFVDNFSKNAISKLKTSSPGSLTSNASEKVKSLLALSASKDDAEASDALNLLEEIKDELYAYESDIVKILKYPVMTDKTNPFTLEMTVALKLANRLSRNPSHKEFVASVLDLEKKFIAAEANALKIASTNLSEIEKKKSDKAKDLLDMAADDASTDNEKEMAFAQAFKQLEGIIFVPEVAVDTFRVKIGLKEIESGL